MDDELKGMTRDQLAQGLREYADSQAPQTPPPPVPAHVDVEKWTPKQVEELSTNWLNWVISRPHASWNPEEIAAVRVACARAAQEMNK